MSPRDIINFKKLFLVVDPNRNPGTSSQREVNVVCQLMLSLTRSIIDKYVVNFSYLREVTLVTQLSSIP